MNESLIIQNLTGYFDVLDHEQGLPKEQWKVKEDGKNISFSVRFPSLPAQFSDFAREWTNTKTGETSYFVEFKIGSNAAWYDECKRPIARPTNLELKDKKCVATILYNKKEKKENPKTRAERAYGYWVNAIMFKFVDADPFAGIDPFTEAEPEVETPLADNIAEMGEAAATFAEQTPVVEEVAPLAPAVEPMPASNSMGDNVELPF